VAVEETLLVVVLQMAVLVVQEVAVDQVAVQAHLDRVMQAVVVFLVVHIQQVAVAVLAQ
jgi:hypothetical protein